MDVDEFNKVIWSYYCILEDRFIELTKYVDARKSNEQTSSNEIISLLFEICSEVETICKMICNVDDKNNPMEKCTKWFIKNIHNISSIEIDMISTKMKITPFREWTDGEPKELLWWKNYNEVKHDRVKNFEKGNFDSLINALGALYFFEMYYIKKIADESRNSKVIDVPISPSKIFKMEKWITRFVALGYNFYTEYLY